MKKVPINKIYSFHNNSSPHDFIARVKDEAINCNLKIKQTENGFDLQIGSNHGGRIVYRANVSADENGGSFISGEMVTVPWRDKSESKQNLFQKILSILGFIIVLPIVLIFLFCYGIYFLFIHLFLRKNIELTNEEKLCDFMTNKMNCSQN